MDEMVRRLERSEARRRSPARFGDEALRRRSVELSRRYLEGRAAPTTVRWVPTMSTRWASCTPADGTIRVSERLREVPGWVVDYVLVHELAHLLEPGHDAAFWGWVRLSHPKTERAMGYLEGLSAAAGLGLVGTGNGDTPDPEPEPDPAPRRAALSSDRFRRRCRSSAHRHGRSGPPDPSGSTALRPRHRGPLAARAVRTPSRSPRGAASSPAPRSGRPSPRRATNAAGSSRSSADGIRSGCAHRASRPAVPRCSPSRRHSSAALRSCRGRSSSPTIVANVCSAGPPEARRRRNVSRSAAAPGNRSPTASATTASTQPSINASTSPPPSAAPCAGVVCCLEHPRAHGLL